MEVLTRAMPTDGLSIPYVVTQSYFATVKWDEAFFWALVLLITYICGIVQSALGMMLYQHFRRTTTTSILIQTESELTHITPMETPITPPVGDGAKKANNTRRTSIYRCGFHPTYICLPQRQQTLSAIS